MRWSLDDVPIFAAIVEYGSMTAAAEALALPKSTVSTAITRLEKAVNLRLFTRNSRSIRLTEEGATFYRHAMLILEQVREAEASLAGLRAEPSGRLTVALPPAFCQELVAPRLPGFLVAYPEIELDIIISMNAGDFLRDRVDLAVVVGPLADSELVVRTLFDDPLVWVASPAFLARAPMGRSLEALRAQIRLCETRYGVPKMPVRIDGEAATIDLATGLSHVGSPLVVRQVVLQGGGVSPLPLRYCRDQIAEGSLVRVFDHIRLDNTASMLSAVFSSRHQMSPRLRVFLDFLAEISV